MTKYLLFFFFTIIFNDTIAQETVFTAEEKAVLDSMMKNDEFLKLMEDYKGSYVDVSMGLSNGVFSIKNNSLNATQAEVKKIFYTPSLAYYHKSGAGISFNGFIAGDVGRLKIFQYGLSPFYSYFGKKVTAGITYTRYFKASSTSFEVSPYKNDLYANIIFKKSWVRPGLALGFANGKTKEYFDTSFLFSALPQQEPRIVRITDTITTKLASFSLTASVSHSWYFDHVFFKKDDIELRPSFLLNSGYQQWNISHSNSLYDRRPVVQKLLKYIYGDGKSGKKFQLQSAALLLDAVYSIGNFTIQPQLYLDYYFPKTTAPHFSTLYSFVVSYGF